MSTLPSLVAPEVVMTTTPGYTSGDKVGIFTMLFFVFFGGYSISYKNEHDDVINWKHFPRYWPLCEGNHGPTMDSPHKGQWRRALIFLWSSSEQTAEQAIETPVIWDAVALVVTISRIMNMHIMSTLALRIQNVVICCLKKCIRCTWTSWNVIPEIVEINFPIDILSGPQLDRAIRTWISPVFVLFWNIIESLSKVLVIKAPNVKLSVKVISYFIKKILLDPLDNLENNETREITLVIWNLASDWLAAQSEPMLENTTLLTCISAWNFLAIHPGTQITNMNWL